MDPLQFYAPPRRNAEEKPTDYAVSDVYVANMEDVNPVVSLINMPKVDYTLLKKGYSPYEQDLERIKGYPAKHFTSSYHPETTNQIIANLQHREKNKRIIDANPVGSFGVQTFGYMSNPLLWGSAGSSLPMFVGKEMIREGASELFMHGSSVGRTGEESLMNVGTAGAGAGIVGVVGKQFGMFGEAKPQTTTTVYGEGTVRKPKDDSAGAQRVPDSFTMNDLDPTSPGLNKVMGFSAPTVKTYSHTQAKATRDFISKFTPLPVQSNMMKDGRVAYNTNATSLIQGKTEIDIGFVENTFDNEFRAYRKNGGKMNEEAFSLEVAIAMRNNDIHADPQVQKVAKEYRKLDDEWYNNSAKAGVYGEDAMNGIKGRLVGAKSHFQRIFRHDALVDAGKMQSLKELLRPRIIASYGDFTSDVKPTKETLHARADNELDRLFDRMRGKGDDADVNIAGYFVSKPGSAHERTLSLVSDKELSDLGFLVDDAREVMNVGAKQNRRDEVLRDMFGEIDMKNVKGEIRDEYRDLMAQATKEGDSKKLSALSDQLDKDLEFVDYQMKSLYGIHQMGKGGYAAMNDGIRAFNTWALLPMPLLSALPEFFTPLLRNSVRQFAKVQTQMLTQLPKADQKRIVNAFGLAMESLTGSRMSAIYEAGSQANSAVVRQSLRQWAKWSGMNMITDFTHRAATLVTLDKWVHQFPKYDSIPAKEKSRLAESGIDKEAAELISEQIELYGKQIGDYMDPNMDSWVKTAEGAEARDIMISAMNAEVRGKQVLEPMAGDSPEFFTSGEAAGVGKFFNQFVSFPFAATTRYGMMGLQRMDAEFLAGAMALMAAGSIVAAAKSEIRGKSVDERDELGFLLDSIDRGGVFGLFGMIPPSVLAIIEGEYRGRQIASRPWEAFMGPGPTPLMDEMRALFKVMTGTGDEDDAYKALKGLPPLNMYHIQDTLRLANEGRGYKD